MQLRRYIILLMFCWATSGFAQQLAFENLGVNNGLPATEAYHLFQDNAGYIWVFTEYGIAKHNGRRFVNACTNLSLERSAIYAVAENSNGEMFIANSKAEVFQVIRDKAYKVYGIERVTHEIVNRSNVHRLFFDDAGTLWFSSSAETYRFTANQYWLSGQKGKKKTFRKRKEVLISPTIKTIWPNKKTEGSVPRFKIGFVQSNGKPYRNWLEEVNVAWRRQNISVRNGYSYYAFGLNLAVYDGKHAPKWIKFDYEVLDMKLAPNGHLWVGLNNGGLLEYDKNLNLVNHYLSHLIVSDILFDDQHGMWLTTVGNGVYHCKNISRTQFSNLPALSKSISMIKRVNGRFFVGTLDGKLFTFKRNLFEQVVLGRYLLPISDIAYFNGKYFVVSRKEVFVLDEHLHFEKTATDRILPHSIAVYDQHNLLLACDARLILYNPSTEKYKELGYKKRMHHLVVRNPGEFFTMDGHKVCRFSNGKLTYPLYLRELNTKRVSRIKVDRNKNVWFCTKGYGIYKLDRKNRLKHYNDLPAKIVNDVSFIGNDLLVLSTNKGAYVNHVNLDAPQFSWERVMNEEVIHVEEMNDNIYFGTKKGLIISRLNQLVHNRNVRFYLESIRVNGKKVALQNWLTLKHDQNELLLNYDFLDYQLTGASIYYQLDGPTPLSGFASDNKVHLQNLEPGEYTLSVSPKVDFTEHKNLSIVTKITVKPAFWQTGIFQALVVVIIFAMLLLLIWFFIRRSTLKKRAKTEIEKLLTEHRLTALKAQVNPHFMSNALVAIQRLILEGNNDNANLYLAKFSLLLRLLLDYSSKSAASVKSELEMITLYVELEQLRFSQQFTFELEIDPEVETSDTFVPALITQPFVENAIWHGLLPLNKSRNPKLNISIHYNDDRALVIAITDNGVGRGIDPKQHTSRKSRGSMLMFERMESMNKLYQTTGGKIIYSDLLDGEGQPIGTSVNIIIPDEMLTELFEERDK